MKLPNFLLSFVLGLIAFPLLAQVPLPDPLEEVSSVAYQKPYLLWMNDGGNESKIFKTDTFGNLLNTFPLPFENIDIEDITVDSIGNIYVADIGNNLNKRRDLVVYKLNSEYEVMDTFFVYYPEQKSFPPPIEDRNYDAEALAFYDNSLHVFTKSSGSKSGFVMHHYVYDLGERKPDLKLSGSVQIPMRRVTSASVNFETRELAILAYHFEVKEFVPISTTEVLIYDLNQVDLNEPKERYVLPKSGATQYEALDWLNKSKLILASERTIDHAQHFIILNTE